MLKTLLLKLLLRKDVGQMAVVYASLIIKGKKTFAQVPSTIKAQVKEILIDLDVPEELYAE